MGSVFQQCSSRISLLSARNVTNSSRSLNSAGRFYRTQGPQRPSATSASPPSPPKKPVAAAPAKKLPHVDGHTVRHEVHEGTAAMSIPFNPPGGGGGPGVGGSGSLFPITNSPLIDAALTTLIGLGIEDAFAAGYDPALELATHQTKRRAAETDELGDLVYEEGSEWAEKLRRKEQDQIDRMVQGQEPGHYFMLLGPKGAGKGTMVFDSMAACQADGVSMCDAHPDLEVFRLRLGKAINFEFHEDSQTGLFQRRDPREGGPALDIERAMNKLEKVALRSGRKRGKPLVLVINNIHFFKNDDEGRNMILQLQQKAEAWSASGKYQILSIAMLLTIPASDDFWPFQIMRKTASRMHVLSVYDLGTNESLHAATRIRMNSRRTSAPPEEIKGAISIVGGRLAYLNKVAKAKDMMTMAEHLKSVEKAWLRSQIGLIPDCDDDVMDEQKWSSCSWLLLQEFVKIRAEQEEAREAVIAAGEPAGDVLELPSIPYASNLFSSQRVMLMIIHNLVEVSSNNDPYRFHGGSVFFILSLPSPSNFELYKIHTWLLLTDLDRMNIIAIDINHNVRPDSMLILLAAQEVVAEDGFEELLTNVRDRIDEIESLHRTRELTFKDVDQGDRINVTVDKGGGNIFGGRIV
ncbi:hypothetical protein H0H81_003409 [Sphagnurus paluster]|uniref:AAA protein C-terminal winged helix domain-containing protein n=1 Tax=Sphagnurus paluster TaxID=117069 RepID=A0A9P7GLH0_9AGAR|nr:hypothetical protein H0H81_003409 [Sphagnurus paluster]